MTSPSCFLEIWEEKLCFMSIFEPLFWLANRSLGEVQPSQPQKADFRLYLATFYSSCSLSGQWRNGGLIFVLIVKITKVWWWLYSCDIATLRKLCLGTTQFLNIGCELFFFWNATTVIINTSCTKVTYLCFEVTVQYSRNRENIFFLQLSLIYFCLTLFNTMEYGCFFLKGTKNVFKRLVWLADCNADERDLCNGAQLLSAYVWTLRSQQQRTVAYLLLYKHLWWLLLLWHGLNYLLLICHGVLGLYWTSFFLVPLMLVAHHSGDAASNESACSMCYQRHIQ